MEEHELKEAILKFRYDAATDFVGQRVLRTFTGTYNRKNQKKKTDPINRSSKCQEFNES